MYHVTFGMPTLVLHVPIDLDELLENSTVTPNAFGGKSRRVVEMTEYVAVVFVVGILGSK